MENRFPENPDSSTAPNDPQFLITACPPWRVRGFPPGTLVNDPNTNKPFRVP